MSGGRPSGFRGCQSIHLWLSPLTRAEPPTLAAGTIGSVGPFERLGRGQLRPAAAAVLLRRLFGALGLKGDATRNEARTDVFNCIEVGYHPKRRHGSAGGAPPAEFARRHFHGLKGV